MSMGDALRRGLARRLRFRTIGPDEAMPAAASTCPPAGRSEALRCTYRPPDADFYCWKYGVWYNLMDCCYRHSRGTYSGCAGCSQGESNLRQHRHRFRTVYLHRPSHFAR
jgi:hypothetical protein